ncbi:MAG: hypothetical protein R3B95_21945, partial [Nitrospirales bacterium]|nr:hypothetical protein [Nitrospirales bacterium]
FLSSKVREFQKKMRKIANNLDLQQNGIGWKANRPIYTQNSAKELFVSNAQWKLTGFESPLLPFGRPRV